MEKKKSIGSIERGWNGFSTLEIQSPEEEQGCSRAVEPHNFLWHPRGVAEAALFPGAGCAGRALWEPAGKQDLSQCPISLAHIPLSGAAVGKKHPYGNNDPSGTASALLQGLDVTPPFSPSPF